MMLPCTLPVQKSQNYIENIYLITTTKKLTTKALITISKINKDSNHNLGMQNSAFRDRIKPVLLYSLLK